jgi:hypothetical protein
LSHFPVAPYHRNDNAGNLEITSITVTKSSTLSEHRPHLGDGALERRRDDARGIDDMAPPRAAGRAAPPPGNERAASSGVPQWPQTSPARASARSAARFAATAALYCNSATMLGRPPFRFARLREEASAMQWLIIVMQPNDDERDVFW